MICKVLGADAQGAVIYGERVEEPCAIIRLPGDDSEVTARIGSAPDYPAATGQAADVVVILRRTSRAEVGDRLEVAGLALKIAAISASFDGIGKLAQHVVEAVLWE